MASNVLSVSMLSLIITTTLIIAAILQEIEAWKRYVTWPRSLSLTMMELVVEHKPSDTRASFLVF